MFKTRSVFFVSKIDDELKELILARAAERGVAAWRVVEEILAKEFKVKIVNSNYLGYSKRKKK